VLVDNWTEPQTNDTYHQEILANLSDPKKQAVFSPSATGLLAGSLVMTIQGNPKAPCSLTRAADSAFIASEIDLSLNLTRASSISLAERIEGGREVINEGELIAVLTTKFSRYTIRSRKYEYCAKNP
jgi:hypothetical protein